MQEVRGLRVKGESLNNALIQLVRLELHSPLLKAPAEAGVRQRKGGEDRKPTRKFLRNNAYLYANVLQYLTKSKYRLFC